MRRNNTEPATADYPWMEGFDAAFAEVFYADYKHGIPVEDLEPVSIRNKLGIFTCTGDGSEWLSEGISTCPKSHDAITEMHELGTRQSYKTAIMFMTGVNALLETLDVGEKDV